MATKEVDLKSSLYPITALCVVFGHYCYTLEKDTFKFSRKRFLQMVICVTAQTAATAYSFNDVLKLIKHDFAVANTFVYFICIYIAEVAVSVIIIFSHLFQRKMYTEVYQSLVNFDNEISQFNKKGSLNSLNRFVRKVSWIMIFIEVSVLLLSNTILQSIFTKDCQVLLQIVLTFPSLIETNHLICLFALFYALEKRFKLINSIMKDEITASSICIKYPPSPALFTARTRQLVHLHKALVKSSNMINNLFMFPLLLIITKIFIVLVTNLYTLFYITYSNWLIKYVAFFYILTKVVTLQLAKLCFLIRRSSILLNEANRTKMLLVGIRIDPKSILARDCVVSSSLRLMQNTLSITACKLFDIDTALLFSIGAAVCSYLFIMLQFKVGSSFLDNENNNETQVTQAP